MPSRRSRQSSNSITQTIVNDLWSSHCHLTTNEYSADTIGLHSCMVHRSSNEHYDKLFLIEEPVGQLAEQYARQLEILQGKMLKGKSDIDIERCAIINRLVHYLRENKIEFEQILRQIDVYIRERMREDPSTSVTPPNDQFIHEFKRRNSAVLGRARAQCMRRFLFFDHDDAGKPENVINLQNWNQTHLQSLLLLISTQPHLRLKLIEYIDSLLDHSFFIDQQPTPPIATHTSEHNGSVSAKFQCRIISLLKIDNPTIIIENIVPIVCRTATPNDTEVTVYFDQQDGLVWKTVQFLTTANTQKIVRYAELRHIVLTKSALLAAVKDQRQQTNKAHYAPCVYYIKFLINVKIQLDNSNQPHQRQIILRSAPFGVVSNTAQAGPLFPDVFVLDIKSWINQPSTIHSNSPVTPTESILTIDELVNCLRRYFIHKTGIKPKHWVAKHIQNELQSIRGDNQETVDKIFYDVLAKIIAQIDYMAEHLLLSLFHIDGLYLAICDSDIVENILRNEYARTKLSVFAIRFGSMKRMAEVRDIGVRINIVDDTTEGILHCKFDDTRMSHELGLFIAHKGSNETSLFRRILGDLTMNENNQEGRFEDASKFLSYYSPKLREICPPDPKYHPLAYNEKRKSSDTLRNQQLLPQLSFLTTTSMPQNNPNTGINYFSNDASSGLYPNHPVIHPLIHPTYSLLGTNLSVDRRSQQQSQISSPMTKPSTSVSYCSSCSHCNQTSDNSPSNNTVKVIVITESTIAESYIQETIERELSQSKLSSTDVSIRRVIKNTNPIFQISSDVTVSSEATLTPSSTNSEQDSTSLSTIQEDSMSDNEDSSICTVEAHGMFPRHK